MMANRTEQINPKGRGIAAPISQITSGAVTRASLLKRIKELKLAVDSWIRLTSQHESTSESACKISQPTLDSTDRQLELATAFVNHLSQAQESLLEASSKLKSALSEGNTAGNWKDQSC